MAILKFRDENGNVQEIVALRGPRGERGIDAYAKAVECGYEGTEEEFYHAMGQNGTMPDTTLSKEGVAADAKTVGDKIDEAIRRSDDEICRVESKVDIAQADARDAYNIANRALLDAHDAQGTADAATSFYTTAEIPAGTWMNMDGYFCAEVFSAANNNHSFKAPVFVDVVTDVSVSTSKQIESAWANVYFIEYSGYDLHLYASKPPTMDLTIMITEVH